MPNDSIDKMGIKLELKSSINYSTNQVMLPVNNNLEGEHTHTICISYFKKPGMCLVKNISHVLVQGLTMCINETDFILACLYLVVQHDKMIRRL